MSDLESQLATLTERVENIGEDVKYMRGQVEKTLEMRGGLYWVRWAVVGAWTGLLALFGMVWQRQG